MNKVTEADYIEDAEVLYHAGYHAASPEDCPYPAAAQGPYVIWMQGYHRHQADRVKVAEVAAYPWCRNPQGSAFCG